MSTTPQFSNRFFPRAQPPDPATAGPWNRTVTVVHLDVATDTVAIGASVMAGSEKFRVVGDGRIEGIVTLVDAVPPGGNPVGGAYLYSSSGSLETRSATGDASPLDGAIGVNTILAAQVFS